MAEQTTISRPSPYLEAAGQTLLDLTTKLTGQPVDTSKFAPSIAGQNVLTQAAQQQAATQAGLGTLSFDPTTGAVTGAGAGTGLLVINLSYNKRQLIQDLKLIKALCLRINKM